MRTAALAWTLCAALAALQAAPAPEPAPAPAPTPANDNTPEVIEIIAPAANAQETLSTLNLGGAGGDLSERSKRTIGILRQLFPTLTQSIQQKIQQLTSVLVRALGPVLLQAALGGRAGAGASGPTGGGGGVVDLDDDDDDEDDGKLSERRARRALPGGEVSEAGAAVAGEERQVLSGAESQQAEVRVAFGEDQQAAAQTNSASIDEITLDDGDTSEENRNKRFLNFGGSADASGGGGGSGNFLFDIVRRPAEAMVRAAGGAFRLFAGTDSLNVGLTASHTATRDAEAQLVAGSSSGGAGAGAEVSVDGADDGGAKGDGLTEGVPGPITRLFIIANRGIANLIQDLILRLAQTSERIVNFKARLITSII